MNIETKKRETALPWIELIPEYPSALDWNRWCEEIPGLRRLDHCVQDPVHHAEGDVGTHTRMVLAALLGDPGYTAAAKERQWVMFMAALLHDIAKPDTTVVDPVSGRIGQPGHSRRGAVDARLLLWHAGAPIELREAVCRLIAVHQVPFFAFDSRKGESAEFIVRKLSWEMDLRELVAVAKADMTGRHCADQAGHLADIELFAELAREEDAWGQARRFQSPHTAVAYFRGASVHPDTVLHQREGSQVIVLSGPPAAGKNTWVRHHRPDWPVVSFDDAREELGLRYGKNEGKVAHLALDKARALLRERKPFVWNATHLSQRMRERTLDLLFAYDAQVEIVHLEQSPQEILRRNKARDTSLSNAKLMQMLEQWEPPLPTEAHSVRYDIGTSSPRLF